MLTRPVESTAYTLRGVSSLHSLSPVPIEANTILRLDAEKYERKVRMLKQRQMELDAEVARVEQEREIESARLLQQQQQQLHSHTSLLHTRVESSDVRHPTAFQPIHAAVDVAPLPSHTRTCKHVC